MGRALSARGITPDLLVPIPLHRARRRDRGFNQARSLAEALGSTLSVPVEDVLDRSRPTASQVGLGRERRWRNVRGAFVARRRLGGETVALVDDVTTSGATLAAAGDAVLGAGAGRAIGVTWALAFAPGDR